MRILRFLGHLKRSLMICSILDNQRPLLQKIFLRLFSQNCRGS